jgi:hypothetical protein
MYSHLSYWLVTVVAALTSFLAYVFDWNETHVYNPRWPPHAKFHNAQTLILGPLLGLSSLWLLWGEHQTKIAIVTASLYWVSQLGSLTFPGTALVDPEFRERPGARIPKQPILASVLLALLACAWFSA